MKPETYPLSRSERLVTQELEDECLIYDLETNKGVCLNKTAALVWQACDGRKSVSEIADFIGQTLNTPVHEDLVWIALDQLKQEKLLVDPGKLPIDFKGASRREVIKRVGLASLVVLPVVTSFFAPQATHAQSVYTGCSTPGSMDQDNGLGCPCNSSAACCATCGGPIDMMTCGGPVINSAAAVCFGVTCPGGVPLGMFSVIGRCPCNSNNDCCAGVCGGDAGMMICGTGANVPQANSAFCGPVPTPT